MNFPSLGKSVVKALKNTGITVGVVAGIAAGTALQDPVVIGAIFAETGPIALLAIPVLSFAGQALVDYLKHNR